MFYFTFFVGESHPPCDIQITSDAAGGGRNAVLKEFNQHVAGNQSEGRNHARDREHSNSRDRSRSGDRRNRDHRGQQHGTRRDKGHDRQTEAHRSNTPGHFREKRNNNGEGYGQRRQQNQNYGRYHDRQQGPYGYPGTSGWNNGGQIHYERNANGEWVNYDIVCLFLICISRISVLPWR